MVKSGNNLLTYLQQKWLVASRVQIQMMSDQIYTQISGALLFTRLGQVKV